MEHRIYLHGEEGNHAHEEFVRESSRGCRALADVQRSISTKLRRYVHLSNIALAYEGPSSPLIKFDEGRKLLIKRIRKILLENPKYMTSLDEAKSAVYHSNSFSGLHGKD